MAQKTKGRGQRWRGFRIPGNYDGYFFTKKLSRKYWEKNTAGKFEVLKDKAGEHRFRLKAGNGEIILTSQGYNEQAGCANGIESVEKSAGNAERFEKTTTDSGKFRFNMKAGNNQVIGTSQNYSTESGRDNGIESVGRSAPDAGVDEVDS
jgi:uncharacterized protein YegP (UPF0339 family)